MSALFRSGGSSTVLSNIYRRPFLSSSSSKERSLIPFFAFKVIRSPVPMASISTTRTLQSNASLSIGTTKYDAEIKDMAAYVHKHEIKSSLAVNIVLAVATDLKY